MEYIKSIQELQKAKFISLEYPDKIYGYVYCTDDDNIVGKWSEFFTLYLYQAEIPYLNSIVISRYEIPKFKIKECAKEEELIYRIKHGL